MKKHVHFARSFVVSVVLHTVVFLGAAAMMTAGLSVSAPDFRHGIASVDVTLFQPVENPDPPAAVVTPAKRVVVRKVEIPKHTEERVVAKPEVVKHDAPSPVPVPVPAVVRQNPLPPDVPVVPVADRLTVDDPPTDEVAEDVVAGEPEKSIPAVEEQVSVPGGGGAVAPNSGVQDLSDQCESVDVHPTYPIGARRRGEEGLVLVKVTLASSGIVENVQVARSSGYSSLDESALSALKKARFVAKNGASVHAGQLTVPLRFRLVD